MSTRPRIKICCISSMEEARLAVQCGADALGLVSDMPSGPGVIPEELIAEIAARVPPPVATFLLTCGQNAEAIIAQQRRTGCNTLQLCDRLTSGTYADLRRALPGIRLVQVVHVTGPESLAEARAAAGADALLLDSGRPDLAVKELGGTGRVHDWAISRQIAAQCRAAVFLAGGLRPENVGRAVETVRPWGVDVCSGVRLNGALDEDTLRRLVAALKG
jgi:phosphoribosylanthranilate isomerase